MLSPKQLLYFSWYVDFLRTQGRRYAIYGAGRVMRQLMERVAVDNRQRPDFIIDDCPAGPAILDVPIKRPDEINPEGIEIILGSDVHHEEMKERLTRLFSGRLNLVTLSTFPNFPTVPKEFNYVAESFTYAPKHSELTKLSVETLRQRLKVDPSLRSELRARFPSATIIVLVHDNLQITRQSLESLVANTFFPYDLIIVDNGSSHETTAWLQKFQALYSQLTIRIIRLQLNASWSRQKKIYSTKNIALNEVRTSFIILNDNDLLYSPYWLYLAVFYYGLWEDIGVLGLQLCRDHRHLIIEERERDGFGGLVVNTVEGCNLIFSKKVFDSTGYFREKSLNYSFPFEDYHGCDVDFTLRAAKLGFANLVPAINLVTHLR